MHVIHSKNPFKEESLWLDDVRNEPNIYTYELDTLYPKVLLTQPKTIIEKLDYKLSLLKVKLFSKGTPYDRGLFWKQPMLELSRQLIERHNIQNVIVSCAPFSCAYYALELKRDNSNLNLMIDLRDPWTWGKSYGFSDLPENRLLFEKRMEYEVVEKSNYILVPSIEMKSHIESVYPANAHKILEIPHAFDEEEVVTNIKERTDKIRLVFYGTIYDNLATVFEAISEAIRKNTPLITLDIYSSSRSYEELFDEKKLLTGSVNYYKPLSPKFLFNKMGDYDYVLIVQPDYAKDFITTKIYEIIYTGTPIILISSEGKLSEFILHHELGLHFSPEQLKEGFRSLLTIDSEIFQPKKFPINNYSFRFITSKLVNCFK